jgi:trimeric autotransporter adhesin
VLALSAPGRAAPTGNASAGVVFMSTCSAGICAPLASPPLRLTDGQPGDAFGSALALDADGSLLAVGAPGRTGDRGAVFIYVCAHATSLRGMPGGGGSPCAAAPTSVLAPSLGTRLVDGGQSRAQRFGRALAVSGDGSTVVVGAPEVCCADMEGRPSEGYFYTFTCEPAAGVCSPPILLSRERSRGEFFGSSIALSRNGNFLVVGARPPGRRRGGLHCQPGTKRDIQADWHAGCERRCAA